MRYILGPLIIIASVAMMKYTVELTRITGKFEFAEKYLQYPLAGTYSFYRIMGVVFIIISLLWMFGFLSFSPENLVQ